MSLLNELEVFRALWATEAEPKAAKSLRWDAKAGMRVR
jgi:hypothetical protein